MWSNVDALSYRPSAAAAYRSTPTLRRAQSNDRPHVGGSSGRSLMGQRQQTYVETERAARCPSVSVTNDGAKSQRRKSLTGQFSDSLMLGVADGSCSSTTCRNQCKINLPTTVRFHQYADKPHKEPKCRCKQSVQRQQQRMRHSAPLQRQKFARLRCDTKFTYAIASAMNQRRKDAAAGLPNAVAPDFNGGSCLALMPRVKTALCFVVSSTVTMVTVRKLVTNCT